MTSVLCHKRPWSCEFDKVFMFQIWQKSGWKCLWSLLGTNLIHDFTAVTCSVKLAFLVCINIAPRNNGCGAREFLKLLPWIFCEIWHIKKLYREIAHFFPWIRLVPSHCWHGQKTKTGSQLPHMHSGNFLRLSEVLGRGKFQTCCITDKN